MKPPSPWTAPSPLPARFETRRLVLRFWEASDAAGMLEAVNADRESLLPWLDWARTDNRNVAECTFNIERFRRERERVNPPCDTYAIGIFDRVTGKAVGGTSLHRMDLASHHSEVGYYIRADRRKQGLCTEAVAGLISWAFTPQRAGGWGLRRIDIFCAGQNKASQAVPRKLGLRQEVQQTGKRWVEGFGWDDTLGWGVLADEWDIGAGSLRRAQA